MTTPLIRSTRTGPRADPGCAPQRRPGSYAAATPSPGTPSQSTAAASRWSARRCRPSSPRRRNQLLVGGVGDSKPVPSAAACSTWRISSVARDTTVPTAISKDERASPPLSFFRWAACRPLFFRRSCGMVCAAQFAPSPPCRQPMPQSALGPQFASFTLRSSATHRRDRGHRNTTATEQVLCASTSAHPGLLQPKPNYGNPRPTEPLHRSPSSRPHTGWPPERTLAPGRAGEAHSRLAEGIGQDLDVHAVALVFPGVVRGVGGDPVDRQQGAVQDHERQAAAGRHSLGEAGRECGQDLDRLAYVAVDGGDPDAEPAASWE